MEAVERVKNEILMFVEEIQKLKTIIDLTEMDEQTKQKVLKEYNLTLRTLNNTMKVKYLLAGGSLTDFNKLLESLDIKKDVQQVQEVKDVDDIQEVKEIQQVKDAKDININDIYKYNLEMIKHMSFDELKSYVVLYTDANKLKDEIIKTITAEKIDIRLINYLYKKIELLNQNHYILISDNTQRSDLTSKLMRLKKTLDAVNELENLRMCLKIYN